MAITRGLPDAHALGGLKDGLAGNQVNAFLGSEALVNNAIQAGSVSVTAGSGWAIFGKPYTNPPVVVAVVSSGVWTDANIGSATVTVQHINTGSAQLLTGVAAANIDWIAFGTY